MDYNLYLKFNGALDLNLNDHLGGMFDPVFADIMYETDEEAVAAEAAGEDYQGTKIGFVQLLNYNQALAMAYGINMTEVTFMTLQHNSKALMELDYTLISQETIDEIGAASNPNIMVLIRIAISAAWRNKGIGEQALKGIIKQMKGKCGYIIILNSEPEQGGNDSVIDTFYKNHGVELAGLEKDPEKAQWKLNAFFQRCGFRLFKNYDNVFVCNVDQAVSERRLVARSVSRYK
jgi:GNAT superfamily N-acetyltransferase